MRCVVLVGRSASSPARTPCPGWSADALQGARPRAQARQAAAGLPQRGHRRAARGAGRRGRRLRQARCSTAVQAAVGALRRPRRQAPGDRACPPTPATTPCARAVAATAEASYVYVTTKSKPEGRELQTRDHRRGRRRALQGRPSTRPRPRPAASSSPRELAQPAAQPLPRPRVLGEEAKKLAKAHGFKCEVLGPKEIAKLGMGSFLAVAQGSDEPPRFIVLQLPGRRRKARRRWCWSARASPSTPAASRSSPRPRWTR